MFPPRDMLRKKFKSSIHLIAIGMGAIVSDWSVIGNWAVVAEGAVVKNKQRVPDRNVAVGIPAKVISEITLEYEKQWTEFKKIYRDLARKRYPNSIKKIC